YNRGAMSDVALTIVRLATLPLVYDVGSPRLQRLVVDMLPWKVLHDLRDMVVVMHQTSLDIHGQTKQALAEGKDLSSRVGGGKDIMSVLSTSLASCTSTTTELTSSV